LGCTLLRGGYDLRKVGDKGPDLLVHLGDKKVWIEAVTPKAGTKQDAVPPLQWNSRRAEEVPEIQILLRFTNAMNEKWKKYKTYLADCIIHPDDCYIIAISWSDRYYSRTPIGADSVPYIIRAVVPYGPAITIVSKELENSSETFSSYREEIEKIGGSRVSTKMFLEREYAGISAIIYSEENLINFPDIDIPEQLGKSFLYLHNPLSENKLPTSSARLCRRNEAQGSVRQRGMMADASQNFIARSRALPPARHVLSPARPAGGGASRPPQAHVRSPA
jgi:type I restriction enzyme S subunit